jgi:transcriptional regulator with XRE-family HTH domain
MGHEIHDARVNRDLTLADVGRAVGLSAAEVSRIEHALRPRVSVWHLFRLMAAVGLDLSIRAYPGGMPLRGAAQSALLARLKARLPADANWLHEVALDLPGDQRAWDAVVTLGDIRIGVEAETRPRDFQELARRIALKERDGKVDRVVLLLLDSRSNRQSLLTPNPLVGPRFPIDGTAALTRLHVGQDPGGNTIILL